MSAREPDRRDTASAVVRCAVCGLAVPVVFAPADAKPRFKITHADGGLFHPLAEETSLGVTILKVDSTDLGKWGA